MAQVITLADPIAANRNRIQRALDEACAPLEEHQEEAAALDRTLEQLRVLPMKVSHQVMVPYGQAAFFPGKLVHTNECMVALGAGYFVEQSAVQASAILDRRRARVQADTDAAHAVVRNLEARLEETSAALRDVVGVEDDREAGRLVEIMEVYDEAVHGSGGTPQQRPTSKPGILAPEGVRDEGAHAAVMARLSKLEEEEAQGAAKAELEFSSDSDDMFDEPAAAAITEKVPQDHSLAGGSSRDGKGGQGQEEHLSRGSSEGLQKQATGKPPKAPRPMRRGFFGKPTTTHAGKPAQLSSGNEPGGGKQPAKDGIIGPSPVLNEVVERDAGGMCGTGEDPGTLGAVLTSQQGTGKPKGILKMSGPAAEQEAVPPKRVSRFKQQRQGLS